MTTVTDVSLDFEQAEAVRRARVDAKLDVKTAIDSGVFRSALHTLVGIGALSSAQARALWEAVTGGTFVPLPAIPWPDAPPGPALYDLIRAKLNRPPGEAGEIDSVVDVLHTVLEVVHLAEDIYHAAASLWHSIFG